MANADTTVIERLHAYLALTRTDPRLWFADPQAIVECAASYEDRLDALQQWRAHAWRQNDIATVSSVDAAIGALEWGAALGQDEPEGAPPGWGYGANET